VKQLLLTPHRLVNSITHSVIVLMIGFVLFSVMERWFYFSRAKKPWRATLLDLQYAFLSMLYSPFIYFFIFTFFGLMSIRTQGTAHDPNISWFVFGIQLAILLVVRDGLIYLRHRIFHLRPIWAFHSIHRSSEEVTWTSAARFHPTESLIEATGEILLFLGCAIAGFDPAVLSVAALFIPFYNYFIHSNLGWTFGPLRYVLVSPVFHRWHHSDKAEATDKNFAAMFSLIDLAFGTFYMPKNVMPVTLGLSAQEKSVHPRTLARQLLYPFRKPQEVPRRVPLKFGKKRGGAKARR
jgi:sterol desaturase/sphingolipid hydroxylase (fatty acid hydroxylase superfamily)